MSLFMRWLLALSLFTSFSIFALPIDVNGSFYVESTYIDNYRGTKQDLGSAGGGSQEIPVGDQDSALFQNYIFRLNPSIIVNDSVTIKGEITNGYLRGGFLGDDSRIFSGQKPLQSLYLNNTQGSNNLTLNQAYAEIASNAALFRIGRFAKHWGLGLVQNGGEQVHDRFFTMFDGVEATFQFKNFRFAPYWARVAAGNFQSSADDVREMGISAYYENKDKGLKIGILASKRNAETSSNYYPTNNKVELKLYDFFVERDWGEFKLGFELPYLSGNYGGADIDALGGVFDTQLTLSPNWKLEGTFGFVGGQDDSSDITAMALHPNFQVAHLLFRYNYFGVENPSINIYDASITNAFFAKIAGEYTRGNWSFELAGIYAKANETAENGKNAYNHSTGTRFLAAADQDSNLGFEIDLTSRYQWYPNVSIDIRLGYLALGDYYAYTNNATQLELSNPWLASLGLGIKF